MVERYSMSIQGPFDRDPPGLEPDNDGDWIRYSDYATLAKRLEEAEAVIRPFATIASAVFYVDEDGREMNAHRGDDQAVWGFDRKELTYGHLRAARAALTGREG